MGRTNDAGIKKSEGGDKGTQRRPESGVKRKCRTDVLEQINKSKRQKRKGGERKKSTKKVQVTKTVRRKMGRDQSPQKFETR